MRTNNQGPTIFGVLKRIAEEAAQEARKPPGRSKRNWNCEMEPEQQAEPMDLLDKMARGESCDDHAAVLELREMAQNGHKPAFSSFVTPPSRPVKVEPPTIP